MNKSSHDITIINFKAYFRSYLLDELKKYRDVTENYLKKAKIEFETSANEQAKNLSNANPNLSKDEIDDILSDDYWRYSERFPRILRNSFLVSIISLFEHEVEQLISSIKKKREIPINLADLNGDLLNKVKLYCKLAGLSLSFENHTWEEINRFYLIRNCIVHNNGYISGFRDEKKLLNYVKKNSIVDTVMLPPSIRPWQIIALTEQFCHKVIVTIQDFLMELEKHTNKT